LADPFKPGCYGFADIKVSVAFGALFDGFLVVEVESRSTPASYSIDDFISSSLSRSTDQLTFNDDQKFRDHHLKADVTSFECGSLLQFFAMEPFQFLIER